MLLFLLLLTTQQAPVILHQSSSGWCSPVIANVVGNVTVNCIGVDPRALRTLNLELRRKNLKLDEEIQEANRWADQYYELSDRLATAGDNTELSRQAADYLHAGDLDKAGELLHRILGSDEKNVDRAAADFYNLGLISEMKFLPADALDHLAKAYQYRPNVPEYGLAYGILLESQNDYAKAEPVLKDTLAREKELEQASPGKFEEHLASTLNVLATIYGDTGRVDDSSNAFQESLKLYQRLANSDPVKYQPSVARGFFNLGALYRYAGRPSEAESYLKQALDAYRELQKSNPAFQQSVGLTLNTLAFLYAAMSNVTLADKYFQDALTIRRELAKSNPAAYKPDVADTLDDRSRLYVLTQRSKEAEVDLNEALDTRRELAKSNPAVYDQDFANTLNDLGELYVRTERFKDAEDRLNEASDVARQLVKSNSAKFDPTLAEILNNLCDVYARDGRLTQAVAPCRESVNLYRELTKRDAVIYETSLGQALIQQGNLYYYAKQLKEAESTYKEAADAYRQFSTLSSNSYSYEGRYGVAGALFSLGNVYRETKQFKEAETSYQDSLSIFSALLQSNEKVYSPNVAQIRNDLAELHSDTSAPEMFNLAKADEESKLSVLLYQKLHETDTNLYLPDLARALNTRGNILWALQRRGDAERALEESLEIRRRLAASDSAAYVSELAASLGSLAALYGEDEKVARENAAFQEAVELFRKVAKANPEAYRKMAATLFLWANASFMQHDLTAARPHIDEAIAIFSELWASEPGIYADAFASSELLGGEVLREQNAEPQKVCELFQSAAAIAVTQEIRDLALTSSAECPQKPK